MRPLMRVRSGAGPLGGGLDWGACAASATSFSGPVKPGNECPAAAATPTPAAVPRNLRRDMLVRGRSTVLRMSVPPVADGSERLNLIYFVHRAATLVSSSRLWAPAS